MNDFNENNQNSTYTPEPEQNTYQPPQYTQQYQYQPPNYTGQAQQPYTQQPYNTAPPMYTAPVGYPQKSRIAAALLAILFGVFGVHNYYLGNTGRGTAQLLLGTLGIALCGIGPIVSAIWSLVEGIQLLKDTVPADGHGIPFID